MPATVSIISEPDYLSPVSSEMWYRVSSPSASTISDYKYVFDVWKLYQFSGLTQSLIGRYKVPPRPNSYDGVLSVNKILKYQISTNGTDIILPDITLGTDIQELYTRYLVKYGFEYNPYLDYYDFVNSPSFGIAFSYNPGFEIGDIITVDKSNKLVNIAYDGEHTVGTYSSGTVSIAGLTFGAYFVGLDGTFGSSTPLGTDGGTITNILRINGTSSKRLGYYGTRQYDEVGYNFTNNYLVATVSSTQSYSYLTNYDGYKPIGPLEYETINFMAEFPATTYQIRVRTYDSGMNLVNTVATNTTLSTNYKYFVIPTGTANLVNTFSLFNLFDNISYYTVEFARLGIPLMELVKRKINNNCSLYPSVRLVFLNRMGGFDYWTFNKDNKKTVNIQRNEYKKVLEPFYTIGDRGYTTIYQDVQYSFSLNSDWITEYDYAYLEELVTSPNIYIVNSDATLTPINIIDTSYTVKTQLRDKLFNLNINYKLSNNINIQNA